MATIARCPTRPVKRVRCTAAGTTPSVAGPQVHDAGHLQWTDGGALRHHLEPGRTQRTAAARPRPDHHRGAKRGTRRSGQPLHPSRLAAAARVNAISPVAAPGARVPGVARRLLSWRCLVKFLHVVALASLLLAWPHGSSAQQSVDYASVSGRVTDPSGAVVPGAQVTARQTQTNVSGDGRDRRGGPVPVSLPARRAVRDHRAAATDFSDASRQLTLTVGCGVRAAGRR